MSMCREGQTLEHLHRDAGAPDVMALGDEVVALVEEFELAIREGRVPPAFAERLAQLRRTAEHFVG